MKSHQEVSRAIHSSLVSDDLRECLDAVAAARGASFSVLFPGPERYSLFLGNANGRADALTTDLDGLERLFREGTSELCPVDATVGGATVCASSTLSFRDEKYGLFLLHDTGSEDLAWWHEVVGALSTELVKTQLYESANRESAASATKLDALNEAGDLVKYVELETPLTKLMELSIRIMHAEVGAIVLDREGELSTGIEWGLSEEVLMSLRSPEGVPLARAWIDEGRCHFIADAGTSPFIDTSNLDVCLTSLAFVPLATQTKRLGAIFIVNAGEGCLREEDAHVLETIAALCGAAIENAILYQTTRTHERIAAEMNLASEIQFSMFPAAHESHEGLDIAGWCVTATETGGDFYDYFDLGNGKTGIVIADATGHGMGAALLVFIARATLRALLTNSHDLAEVMRVMNDLVEADSDDARFLTCFFGVLDRATGHLDYCIAGHDPPFVRRGASGEIVELQTGGIPLGMFPGVLYYVSEFQLEREDFVVLGTDGIWEARNRAGEFYGKERLLRAMHETHALPTHEASERIRQGILEFHEGGERLDDITAVTFHRR
ncbi:SpoIIE family protein phosphatase [bacterium]|nr:SpoIIE family protein phosphatase [bacterium]